MFPVSASGSASRTHWRKDAHPGESYNDRVRAAASNLRMFIIVLLRLAANAIIAQQGVAAAERGLAWWALAIPLEILALLMLVLNCGIIWVWANELRGVKGHS